MNNALNDFPIAERGRFESLANGDDAYGSLVPDSFVGVDGGSGQRTGIKSMEDIEDISIVMAPGMWARSIVNELLRHSRAMRYRLAVLDAPLQTDIEGVRAFRAQFDSKYAALWRSLQSCNTFEAADLQKWERVTASKLVVHSVLAIGSGRPVLAKEVAEYDGVKFQTAAARLRSAEQQGMLKKHGRKGWMPTVR